MKCTGEKELDAEVAVIQALKLEQECSPGGRKKLVDINKEPIKSLCPPLSESWDLEGKKEAVSRVVWVELQEPHGDLGGGR